MMKAAGKVASTSKRLVAGVVGVAAVGKGLHDMVMGSDASEEQKAQILQQAEESLPQAGRAAAPAAGGGGGGGGAGGGSPAAGGTASAIDRLAAVNQQVLEAIEKSHKDGGEFVTKLVVDGEELASHTYKWIRDSLSKEFKLMTK